MDEQRSYYVRHTLSGKRRDAVDRLRQRIADTFGVFRALRSPPHVTLLYPFETSDITSVQRGFSCLVRDLAPFTVPVVGFCAFGEVTWFIDPVQDERLSVLKKTVADVVFAATGTREQDAWDGTHFHVTLAYKDVSPEAHRSIGAFLKAEPLPIDDLLIDSVTLIHRRTDGRRDTVGEYPFQDG